MPEYLAPGVYVEETSFRSRSIEGVSTTTTAFIGPTLKGPYGNTPQLLTSFADFARIYGGLDDIDHKTNYLAHAVRAFFDNGGSRLYVARVVPVDNQKRPALPTSSFARSHDLFADNPDNIQVQFVARFPGEGGNGEIEIFQQATPVSQHLLNGSPVDSILRVKTAGENLHAQPAHAKGGNEPFFIPDGGQLLLTIGTDNRTVTFRGRPAEVVSTAPVPDTVNLPADSSPAITVNIGSGPSQSISLPTGNGVTRAAIVATINQNLRGGYARLTDANALAIGTDVRGLAARIQVNSSAGLPIAFPADPVGSSNSAENNVRDLGAVTIADIAQILSTANIGLEARSGGNGHQQLVLQTTATGENARFQVRTGDNSVHSSLGLTVGELHIGVSGATSSYFAKTDPVERTVTEPQYSAWKNIAGESLSESDVTSSSHEVSLITLAVIARDSNGTEVIYEGLGLSPSHPRWIGHVLSQTPGNQTEALNNPFAIELSATKPSALTLYGCLAPPGNEKSRLVPVRLAENADLGSLSVQAYEAALDTLLPLEEISIVAAPGYSAYYTKVEAEQKLALGIQDRLKTFVERRRSYQIAVLDSPPKADFTTIRTLRSQMDSEYAALYYPWVTIANPLASPDRADIPSQIDLPPSGFICGIYARNDVQRGVYKAPANEVIRGALGLETNINFDQQGALNPQGINCLRFFPGRGYRVWGARLATSNSEVKYVSDRRYLNYLERSIDQGTQFAVFEPNGPKLWINIRDTISSFLYNEWFSGALLGTTPQEAFFVRCDRSTMTQNDLDNGRLICLVGVALQKPAEFVIFRLGQAVLSGGS
ncbi:phage tail sheath family protein [Leptolyngbya sp. AN02str]|uniref:phage tail sheath family protein n=1 Tax=Leptolyngbya sp. AN02str TaxID=3423363 RepID=UPI003D31B235